MGVGSLGFGIERGVVVVGEGEGEVIMGCVKPVGTAEEGLLRLEVGVDADCGCELVGDHWPCELRSTGRGASGTKEEVEGG